jgi:hypothetical protein
MYQCRTPPSSSTSSFDRFKILKSKWNNQISELRYGLFWNWLKYLLCRKLVFKFWFMGVYLHFQQFVRYITTTKFIWGGTLWPLSFMLVYGHKLMSVVLVLRSKFTTWSHSSIFYLLLNYNWYLDTSLQSS